MNSLGHHRRPQSGFMLVLTLLLVLNVATFISMGLIRATMLVTSTERFVALEQAFQLAEAAIDAELVRQTGRFSAEDIAGLLDAPPRTVTMPSGIYTVSYADDGDPGNDVVVLAAYGTSGSEIELLRVRLRLSRQSPAAPPIFNYASAGTQLSLSGNATLGDPLHRVPLYLHRSSASGGSAALSTTSGNQVWISQADFVNPLGQPLEELCSNCSNPAVFPVSPAPAPVFRTSGVEPLPGYLAFDLRPYYDRAIAQCVAEGDTPADCEAGTAANSWHHITSDSTISGDDVPGGLDGVIYVEAGVEVELKDEVVIRGTVVHEGTALWNSGHSVTVEEGVLEFAAGSRVWILSWAEPNVYYDIDQNGERDPPFAPGAAVLGGATLRWKNTASLGNGISPGIEGFVMAGGYELDGRTDQSTVDSEGVIHGGVVGVKSSLRDVGVYGPAHGIMGPAAESLQYDLYTFRFGGPAKLEFGPLPPDLPGFSDPGSGGGTEGAGGDAGADWEDRPTLLSWSY